MKFSFYFLSVFAFGWFQKEDGSSEVFTYPAWNVSLMFEVTDIIYVSGFIFDRYQTLETICLEKKNITYTVEKL